MKLSRYPVWLSFYSIFCMVFKKGLLVLLSFTLTFSAAQSSVDIDIEALFGNSTEQQPKKVVVVQGTGDSESILRIIASHFNQKYPEITVLVPDGIGSLGGVRSLLNGGADLARTARSFTLESRGGGREIFMVDVPLVFVIHRSVKGVDNLSQEQILQIYSGGISNWTELGGPNAKIYPVTRQAGASSFIALKSSIDKFGEGHTVSKIFYSTTDVEQAVADHDYTIGYLPLSAVVNSNLKVLSLNGVAPTLEALQSGDYPHKITFYLTAKKSPKEHVKTFVDFATSEEAKALYADLLENKLTNIVE